ncbi:putative membrane protein [Sporomusaceae bacterium BoRhaA]|uniref:DUF1648 domain-containing protein n=1 Tax=Pelorhabdus rhamnosifermentans TaxID=2772457 RepID=UPI001C05FEB7|nr:DUF1648 domain-containing protein [Pelorhabdus rhamnosifermentans]MBU2703356.1 putative membrane protein [Pelorhabdus rhamnosifermentans]
MISQEESSKKLCGFLTLQFVSFILVIVSFYFAIPAYSALPNTFPVHFDLSGTPNRWESKSWIGVLQLPLIQLGVFTLIAAVTFWSVYSPRSLAYLNLPQLDKTKALKLPDEKQKEIRLLGAGFTSMITLFTSLMFTIINYQLLRAETTGRISSMVWIIIVVVIGLLGSIISVRKLTTEVKRISGE